jgi:hypothetical protein
VVVNRCRATNANGAPCEAQPVRADGYCYWHSPQTAAEREANRRKGGHNRSNVQRAKRRYGTAPLSTDDLRELLAETLRRALAGSIDPPLANAIANLSRVALAANEASAVSDLMQRLAALESTASATG